MSWYLLIMYHILDTIWAFSNLVGIITLNYVVIFEVGVNFKDVKTKV